jgi:hypothetical protein
MGTDGARNQELAAITGLDSFKHWVSVVYHLHGASLMTRLPFSGVGHISDVTDSIVEVKWLPIICDDIKIGMGLEVLRTMTMKGKVILVVTPSVQEKSRRFRGTCVRLQLVPCFFWLHPERRPKQYRPPEYRTVSELHGVSNMMSYWLIFNNFIPPSI